MLFSINEKNYLSVAFYNENRDLIRGYKFNAAMSFSTPLNVLRMHGMKVSHPSKIIPLSKLGYKFPYDNGCLGMWMCILEVEDISEKCASPFGQLSQLEINNHVMPLLLKYQDIIASFKAPSEKYDLLNKLTEDIVFKPYLRKFLSIYKKANSLGDYWAIENLTSQKGIGLTKAKKFISEGFYCTQQINGENSVS